MNFLAYYKCYWNFVKGASISDESSELLYITITSVRYNEISDLKKFKEEPEKLKKSGVVKKIKYQYFAITTEDSKEIRFYFPLDDEVTYDYKGYISDLDELSDIEKRVQQLRKQLRQRRIDYQQVRAVDSDFKI